MCGIVAVLPRYDLSDWSGELDLGLGVVLRPTGGDLTAAGEVLGAAASALLTAVGQVGHPAALGRLATDEATRAALLARLDECDAWAAAWDAYLDGVTGADPTALEVAQRESLLVRDRLYTLRYDRLDAARRLAGLGFAGGSGRLAISYLAMDTALEAIDRLEVRGRDSAGIQLWVGLDPADRAAAAALVTDRDDLYRSGAAEVVDDGVVFVYKRAVVLGALGDNVAHLRERIAADQRLATALRLPSARVSVLSHTRWASVGRVTEANAHPVNSVPRGRFTSAVLNGDIDNHVELRRTHGVVATEITTDAKLVPVLVAEAASDGLDLGEALRSAVDIFDGSMAIGAQSDADTLALAVKGSGQGLYVGLAGWAFIVASEVYGLVSWTDHYLRLDSPSVVVLERAGAGTLAGVRDVSVPGEHRVRQAEVTTRDVARGAFEHYLIKEISGAPASFRKSLRGRFVEQDGRLHVAVELPAPVRAGLAQGRFREVIFVGQGTAAVACQGIAEVIRPHLTGLVVRAVPATELSAQALPDLTATLVVAVSQSGTTTDTNRAVDMVRGQGAAVMAIVNRRDSDLTHKADGTLYTSDGRDVEMAVASTKAFYSQVATGVLLGLSMAAARGGLDPAVEHGLLAGLLDVPGHLAAVQELSPRIAAAARLAPAYPAWAVVGSGLNRVAAAEVRIKLSELCYRTVSTDALEDKKHIDLSAEALILVCAAGTPPQQIRDMAKEIEIFTAHHNAPVVIVDEGIDVAWAAREVIRVPRAHPALAWIVSTAVGHLFAYHAARAISELGRPLREALGRLEERVDAGATGLSSLHAIADPVREVLDAVSAGSLNGVLSPAATLGLLNTVLVLTRGEVPHEDPVTQLRAELTRAVDELTRSIDSVKHQAKTVTVGTSRGDADLLDNPLVHEVGDPSLLTYGVLLALRAYAPLVAAVTGAIRYRIDDGVIQVVSKVGAAVGLASRADSPTPLTGSKQYVADRGAATILRGGRDGRLVLMVPEQAGSRVSGLTLFYITLVGAVEPPVLMAALEATAPRLAQLTAAVTEVDATLNATALAKLPVETALLGPIAEIVAALAVAA